MSQPVHAFTHPYKYIVMTVCGNGKARDRKLDLELWSRKV